MISSLLIIECLKKITKSSKIVISQSIKRNFTHVYIEGRCAWLFFLSTFPRTHSFVCVTSFSVGLKLVSVDGFPPEHTRMQGRCGAIPHKTNRRDISYLLPKTYKLMSLIFEATSLITHKTAYLNLYVIAARGVIPIRGIWSMTTPPGEKCGISANATFARETSEQTTHNVGGK